MIGCLRTHVRKQPIIVLYFESELVLKLYNLEARLLNFKCILVIMHMALFVCVSMWLAHSVTNWSVSMAFSSLTPCFLLKTNYAYIYLIVFTKGTSQYIFDFAVYHRLQPVI